MKKAYSMQTKCHICGTLNARLFEIGRPPTQSNLANASNWTSEDLQPPASIESNNSQCTYCGANLFDTDRKFVTEIAYVPINAWAKPADE